MAEQPESTGGKSQLGRCPDFPDPFECSAIGKHTRRLGYVLPTESQWEYACRAGTTTATHGGRQLPVRMRIITGTAVLMTGNDFKQTRDVGQYAANPWGFFDMHGNVWEWTADWYQAAYPTATRWWIRPDRHRARIGSPGWFLEQRRARPAFC